MSALARMARAISSLSSFLTNDVYLHNSMVIASVRFSSMLVLLSKSSHASLSATTATGIASQWHHPAPADADTGRYYVHSPHLAILSLLPLTVQPRNFRWR